MDTDELAVDAMSADSQSSVIRAEVDVQCSSSSGVLDRRHWVHVSDQTESTPRFRLLTYNILSDSNIGPGEYLYCPAHLRYMSSRHERIMAEISDLEPHVVCLQVTTTSN